MTKAKKPRLGAAVPETRQTAKKSPVPNAFTIPTTSLTGSMKRADLAAAISRRSTAANSRARAQGRNLLPIGVLTGKDSRTFSAPVIGAERGRAATDNNQRMRKTSI